jgi:hypothetical protein
MIKKNSFVKKNAEAASRLCGIFALTPNALFRILALSQRQFL